MLQYIIAPCLMGFVLVGGSRSDAAAPEPPLDLPVVAQHAILHVSADTITLRIRVLQQRRHGDTLDVVFRLEVDGAPADKTYQVFMQDMGMQQRGLPPVPLPNPETRFRFDANGELVPDVLNFNLAGFARGEWVQFTFRSTDGAISKTVRYTPLN